MNEAIDAAALGIISGVAIIILKIGYEIVTYLWKTLMEVVK